MKRFIVHDGWVRSAEDGDEHFIGCHEVARLHGVRFEECIMNSSLNSGPGLRGIETWRYLELFPSEAGFYSKIKPTERLQYPLEEKP